MMKNPKKLLPLHECQEILYEQNPDSKVTQRNKGVVLDKTNHKYIIRNESGCEITQNQVILKANRGYVSKFSHANQVDRHVTRKSGPQLGVQVESDSNLMRLK